MVAARKSRRGLRSGMLMALALIGSVGLATLVVWRRGRGVAEAKIVGKLETERRELTSQKTALDRDLRDAVGRARIVPLAETRLGMHVAGDAEVPSLPPAPNKSPSK